ncbi:unnamed protein product, partial [Callosobruchus maculatus]
GAFQWCTWTNWRSNSGVTVFWRIPVACLWGLWLFLIKQWRDCFLANTSGVSGCFRLNSGVEQWRNCSLADSSGVSGYFRLNSGVEQWRNCSLTDSSGVSGCFELNSGVAVLWSIPVACLDVSD